MSDVLASRRLLILYGSQSGCSKDVAEQLERDAIRNLFQTEIAAMDEYDVRRLPTETFAIFVCSTTGQGAVPDNMKRTWNFLRRTGRVNRFGLSMITLSTMRCADLGRSLSNLQFTVFGLGDSSYPLYNAVARRLFQRLLDLGGTAFHPRGLGDDQHPQRYDGELVAWSASLWQALHALLPLPPGLTPMSRKEPLPPRYAVTLLSPESLPPPTSNSSYSFEECSRLVRSLPPRSDQRRVCPARVVDNRLLTAHDHDQQVRHLEFRLTDPSISYAPGDVLGVLPRNPPGEVDKLLNFLGLNANVTISIKALPRNPLLSTPQSATASALPAQCTVRQLFEHHLDFMSVPRRYFFQVLSMHAREPREVERLCEFGWDSATSAALSAEFEEYCQREKRSHAEVLYDFPSVAPCLVTDEPLTSSNSNSNNSDNLAAGAAVKDGFRPLTLCALLDVIPPLQPRLFSISSSPHPMAHSPAVTASEVDMASLSVSPSGTASGALPAAETSGLAQSELSSASLAGVATKEESGEGVRAQITVSMVAFRTPMRRQRVGLCSSWLSSLSPSRDSSVYIPVFLSKGSFRIPAACYEGGAPAPPLVMVGPGTGIAPFRAVSHHRAAFLQQRRAAATANASSAQGASAPSLPDCLVFLGNRKQRADWLYEGEWARLLDLGAISHCFAAFSRDPVLPSEELVSATPSRSPLVFHPLQSKYVQHSMQQQGALVWRLLAEQGGIFLLAGNAKQMPKDVRAALAAIASSVGGLSEEDAQQWLRQLDQQGRYQIEAWW